MEKADILTILRSKGSVFTFKDILLATKEAKPLLLARRLSYYIKKGELYHIRRGLYAKDKNYNRQEVATKIFTPSYVSFETVLAQEGIIFQYYSTIFVATYQTKNIVCDGQSYSFKKIKDEILTNNAGIENKGSYSIASKERAFLDVLYLNKNYYFDNLAPLDFDKVFALLPMYNNQRMTKMVNLYLKDFHSKMLKSSHAGVILKKEFLDEFGLSQNALARAIRVPPNRIHDIVRGKRAITADTDLRLCRFFGLSDGFFLRLQMSYELLDAQRALAGTIKKIEPYTQLVEQEAKTKSR